MYKGTCSCGAVQFEVDHIDEFDTDDETLSNSDNRAFSIDVDKDKLFVDASPSALAKLNEACGDTHHVCNVCGSTLFTEKRSDRSVRVDVVFTGHDVRIEPHRQFVF